MNKQIKKLNESKIMLICTTDNMIWQFLIPHIQDLLDAGAQVDCICSKTGFWFDELKDKFGFNVLDVKMERSPLNKTNIKAYNTIKQLQQQNHYDLIYCQQPVGAMLGRFIGKKYNLPVIYTAHGFFFFKGNNPIKNFIFKSAEKFMSRSTDVLITMNDEDYLASQNWPTKLKYKIHGIGFEPNKYSQEPYDKAELKRSLNIDENDKIILSVAEFIKRKNYPTMLQSFAKLNKSYPNATYVLCGTGKQFEEMQAYAKELGIASKVKFLGYRKDIDRIMQISDVMFHQSFQEGLTMSLMEAMHFGLPVVTSSVRGNQDLIVHQKGGFITDCTDQDSQVKSLITILNHPELAKLMGEYNQRHVKDYYIDSVRTELKNIYKNFGIL